MYVDVSMLEGINWLEEKENFESHFFLHKLIVRYYSFSNISLTSFGIYRDRGENDTRYEIIILS